MKELNITCFLATARALNISVAAHELALTQQAVSRHIRSLEEELGCTLLHRRNDGIRLTPAGKHFREAFLDYDKELRNLFLASSVSHPPDRLLRIGWSEWSGCPAQLLRIMDEFCEKHPSIQIDTYVLPDHALRLQLLNKDLDVVFLTKYALGSLADRVLLIPGPEIPMYFVSTSIPGASLKNIPHLTSRCCEDTSEEILERVNREYLRIDQRPGPINILPNHPSVYAQLLCGGITISPINQSNSSTSRFHLHPLGWNISLYAAANPGYSRTTDIFLDFFAGKGDFL